MSNEKLAGLLGLTDWREAMLAVPREAFAPETGFAYPEVGSRYPIDRQARPDEWRNAVFSDTAIITQRADGQGDPADEATGQASSSLSAPGVAFAFLSLLSPLAAGNRVLDIGTGTGYTSAVIAARVGEENVTTFEVDPDVSAQAVTNLKAAGFAPHVFVGDAATTGRSRFCCTRWGVPRIPGRRATTNRGPPSSRSPSTASGACGMSTPQRILAGSNSVGRAWNASASPSQLRDRCCGSISPPE